MRKLKEKYWSVLENVQIGPSRPFGYDQVAGFDAFLLIAMLHSCVRLFGHSRCCRSTGFANRRWALLLLTRWPLRVFVRRSLLTPDGPCLSVWVQSLACGVFVRRALRTPDGPFLSVWVQNLACGVCVCVILGVSVCVCHSRCGCVVCVLCCVWVFRVCVLPLRAPWQLGRLGSSADVGTATQLAKPRKEAGTPAMSRHEPCATSCSVVQLDWYSISVAIKCEACAFSVAL